MFLAFECHKDTPLKPILQELDRNNIAYEVRQDQQDTLSLWLANEEHVSGVQGFFKSYQNSSQHTLSIANMSKTKITAGVLIVTALVALLTQLGDENRQWFFIAHMQWDPRGWYIVADSSLIWRSISPIFLHFGVEHFIFNCLSFWYLGSVLERTLGKAMFASVLVVSALVSNYVQLLLSGPLFGGLSGVVYGFIGFAAVYQTFYKNLNIPKGLFYIAIIWLLLGMTDFFAMIGLGNIANGAHVAGLASGLILSTLSVVVLKMKGSK